MNGHTNRGGVEALALGQGAGLNGDGSGAGGGLGSDNGSAAHCVVILLKGRREGKEVMKVASAGKRGAEHFAQSLTSRRNGFSQRISPSSNHNQYPFREFGRFHHSKIRQVKSAILLCGWPTKRRFYPRLSSDQERKSPTAGSL